MTKPYSKNYGWSNNFSSRSEINKSKSEWDVTLEDLESRYNSFCSYADEPGYKARVFEMWGYGGGYLPFKHKGFQKFI